VRELQNVIERAVITAQDGKLNFQRAFPSLTTTAGSGHPLPDLSGVLTARELARLERENLRRALEATHWQIAGEEGAAKLLGLAPSTLASRVKALRLRRHR
jgi:transcriptional regulator with GAF, ATPase, and Fis domain